ncbi:MAG: phosphoribosylglycinamide synthetase C domain-containing protein [Chloroflexota bacterium]
MRFGQRAYVDVVLCAEGYPGRPKTGARIDGIDDLPDGVWVFHGATTRAGDALLTSGGRVLHVVGGGDTVTDARRRAYEVAGRIRFEGKFYRSDIAAREVGVA